MTVVQATGASRAVTAACRPAVDPRIARALAARGVVSCGEARAGTADPRVERILLERRQVAGGR